MKIYTEKQLQEKINERMAQMEEHRWNVEQRERMEKQMYQLDQRISELQKRLDETDIDVKYLNDGYERLCNAVKEMIKDA